MQNKLQEPVERQKYTQIKRVRYAKAAESAAQMDDFAVVVSAVEVSRPAHSPDPQIPTDMFMSGMLRPAQAHIKPTYDGIKLLNI